MKWIIVLSMAFAAGVIGLCSQGTWAQGGRRVVIDKEIYETPEAAQAVKEARSFDPKYCPQDSRDRDKAAELYAKAIELQPGARINAMLADRIAQLYAFYEDRDKKVKPDPAKAARWWQRCTQESSPRQLVWAQANMGLAQTCGTLKDPNITAPGCFEQIIQMDIEEVKLAEWMEWPGGGTDREARVLAMEKENLRTRVEDIQCLAVRKLFERLSRDSEAKAKERMKELAAKYKETHIGRQAQSLLGPTSQPASSPSPAGKG